MILAQNLSAAFQPVALTFATVEEECMRFVIYCRDLSSDDVVIDLANVQQCDSAGLAFLLEVKRIASAQGKSVKTMNMSDKTRSLAEFYGIGALL